ncbi:sugar phosphate isomerase/epimerase family protein [Halopiger xanaduensis]|uniref:Xylose isomerase domain-containing protein TIM barrel n=1 Tax=Halopiger xanaduensis (strain DSM 18323 / JCM 14033 / SH-6) TaxID=797210 RepID=F8D9E2_HALXS|nr:sugar phosphate isomerase/epimerase [Halopiger xanaduensis]AEH36883.1 Xylose isomerase domain-containing protein TIM barrel [Halopiger xanaduensis SH-6]
MSQPFAFDPGVQSVVFGDDSVETALERLAASPTELATLELWAEHRPPTDDAADRAALQRGLAGAGVDVRGYGVVDLADTGEAREYVAFASRLGADYVTVNYPPDRDDITEELLALAAAFEIDVAIHNYSSVHHDDLSQVFSSIDDVRAVLERHDDPRLGVCVDTGHFLVASVDPAAVVREFGDRIVAVHLKDTSDAEVEDLPGAGALELERVVGLLDEHVDREVPLPLIIEYELPAERAVDALAEAERNVRDSLAALE